jgi:hypothetical protein
MDMTLLALILIFGYIFFYINSKKYLVREYFEAPALTPRSRLNVSWPGGVVSPPPFGQ